MAIFKKVVKGDVEEIKKKVEDSVNGMSQKEEGKQGDLGESWCVVDDQPKNDQI